MGGGGMNMDMINSMMSNPQIQQMANQFLSGGGLGGMGGMGGGGMPNMDMIRNMMGNMGMGGANNYSQPPPPQPVVPKVEPDFTDDFTTFRYLKANVPQVVNKLKTTLKDLPNYSYTDADDVALDKISTFLTLTVEDKSVDLDDSLKKISSYVKILPEKQVFPVLDLYRLMLKSPRVVEQQVTVNNSLLHVLKDSYLMQWTSLSAPTQLMAMRALANLVTENKIQGEDEVAKNKGASWLSSNMTGIADIISLTLSFEMDGLRSCSAGVAANLSLLVPKKDDNGLGEKLVNAMVQNIGKEKVEEVTYRMVLTIYRCLKNNPALKEFVKVPMLASAMQKESCKSIVRGIIKMITSN